MATIGSFEEMEVWQIARNFSRQIFDLTRGGSFSKDFSLRDQIVRAAGSIPDNIAEGFERDGNREFIHFLSIAKASAGEVRSQLYQALDRGHVTDLEFKKAMDQVVKLSKMISGFMKYLEASPNRGRKYKSR